MTRLFLDPHCRVIFDDSVFEVELTPSAVRAPLQSDRVLVPAIGMSNTGLAKAWHDAGIRVCVHVDKPASRAVSNRFEATDNEAFEASTTKLRVTKNMANQIYFKKT